MCIYRDDKLLSSKVNYIYVTLTQQVFKKGSNYIRCMATIDVRYIYHDIITL